MSKSKPDLTFKALVLSGDGINCEKETASAATMAGFKATTVHVNDFLKDAKEYLHTTNLLVLPGGFSFGDELGSGRILSLKLKHGLKNLLNDYITRGGLVLGICNGFQVLVQLGIWGSKVALVENACGHFINRWVGLKIIGKSVFTDFSLASLQPAPALMLPIRHGEGRLNFTDEAFASELLKRGQCVLQYNEDVNGSWHQIAALSAHEGRVLGLMPHPEAFWTEELCPSYEKSKNETAPSFVLGTQFFLNAFDYLRRQRQ